MRDWKRYKNNTSYLFCQAKEPLSLIIFEEVASYIYYPTNASPLTTDWPGKSTNAFLRLPGDRKAGF
jgi:hypothetical protein